MAAQSSNPFDSVVFAGLAKDKKAFKITNIEKLTDFCTENGCKVLIGSPKQIQMSAVENSPKLKLAMASEILFFDSDPEKTKKKESRTTKLAHLRNNLLTTLKETPLLNQAEHVAVVDLDGVIQFDNATLTSVKKALELPGWDGLSFYSENYYDMWALRCKADTPNCFHTNYAKCNDKTQLDMSCLDNAKVLEDSSLLEVASAFNGMNLYKTKAIEDCLYDGTDKENGMDCEHVTFNKCISAKGKKFVMTGPDMQIRTKWKGI